MSAADAETGTDTAARPDGRTPVLTVLQAPDDPRSFPEAEKRAAQVRYATTDTLAREIHGADALLLWDYFSGALQDAWPHADALRWIHIAAAGVDTLLFDGLAASDVVVTNSRGIFDRPIAEFVLGSILAFAKDMPRSLGLQAERRWVHRETESIDGAHAMIVGTGAIGRETARLLRAAGMRVTGVGSRARGGDADFGDVHASDELARPGRDALLDDVDHLVLVAPLTGKTHAMIDAGVLSALPARARVVNVGRGELMVTDDLVAALHAGQRGEPAGIAGAALDVFETEPLPAEHPLWSIDSALVTPHMAGDAAGWRERLAEMFTDNFARYAGGTDPHALRNVVDKQRGYVR